MYWVFIVCLMYIDKIPLVRLRWRYDISTRGTHLNECLLEHSTLIYLTWFNHFLIPNKYPLMCETWSLSPSAYLCGILWKIFKYWIHESWALCIGSFFGVITQILLVSLGNYSRQMLPPDKALHLWPYLWFIGWLPVYMYYILYKFLCI